MINSKVDYAILFVDKIDYGTFVLIKNKQK
jgi:hypothetical protein